MTVLSLVLGLAAVSVAQAGIYPDGHWDRCTELDPTTADSFVKENVDKGKTAPSWNAVVEKFQGNADVVFGDVALSKNQVRTVHGVDQNPGAGGWPTIRYFNKGTGYGGAEYPKKTDKAMCDELGPKETYMQQFVEEQGGVSLCNAHSLDGCSDQAKTYIGKWKDKPIEEWDTQLKRLGNMADGGAMKPEALQWVKQRMGIFKQLKKKKEEL